MRLKIPRASAEEKITALLNRGYQVLHRIEEAHSRKREREPRTADSQIPKYEAGIDAWVQAVCVGLCEIFPSDLQANFFVTQERFRALASSGVDYRVATMLDGMPKFIARLRHILDVDLAQHTDLPIQARLYVEDIDSFQKVRDVNPHLVTSFLPGGFLDWSEDRVQLALEQILGLNFHRKDWGGELNDLCTANVVVNGARRATAFLLKGPGIGRKEMTIADCGKNGDQLVRLFTTPADLFVVQSVGPIADLLVRDVEGKTAELRSRGKEAHFLIMDGQDTARVMHAYGKL